MTDKRILVLIAAGALLLALAVVFGLPYRLGAFLGAN